MMFARRGGALALAAVMLGAAKPNPISVTYRDQVLKLAVAPVLRNGRVLVPARAVFSALGATVLYDPQARLLVVRRAGKTAIVTSSTIIANRSYVPLRAIAHALDLEVAYDGSTRRVEVFEHPAALAAAIQTRRPIDGPTVESRHPQADEQIYSGFPTVYAIVQTHGGPEVDRTSVRINLDGIDVTSRSKYVGDAITYTPSMPLLAGPHNVTIGGADLGGLPFAQSWTFYSRYNPSQVNNGNGAAPSIYVPGGTYTYHDRISITAIGPPGGYGYLTIEGLGTYQLMPQYAQPGYYIATLLVPSNVYLPHAYVSGYISAGGRRYTLRAQQRLFIDSRNSTSNYATPRATMPPAAPAQPLPTAVVRTPMPPPEPRVPR